MSSIKGCIYKATSPSGKSYIGQTIYGIQNRWKDHIYDAFNPKKDRCKLLNVAIRKYGKNAFTLECVEECEKHTLDAREAYYITNFNTLKPNGYNLKQGGSSSTHTEETKQKIRNTLRRLYDDEKTKQVILDKREGTKDLGLLASYTKQGPIPRPPKDLSYNVKNPHLPRYISPIKKKGILVGYRVIGHPKQESTKSYINQVNTADHNLEMAKTFLKELDKVETGAYSAPQIPYCLRKLPHGYHVSIKGKRKQFARNSKTDEELYTQVQAYIQSVLSATRLDPGDPLKLLVPS